MLLGEKKNGGNLLSNSKDICASSSEKMEIWSKNVLRDKTKQKTYKFEKKKISNQTQITTNILHFRSLANFYDLGLPYYFVLIFI